MAGINNAAFTQAAYQSAYSYETTGKKKLQEQKRIRKRLHQDRPSQQAVRKKLK